MTERTWQRVEGRVERGHGVASGVADTSPYPKGTIEMQAPIFKALGLDLTDYVQGTLNISISPRTFELLRPELTFRQVAWTDRHPPEDFSFARCRILFQASTYDGWIYYPHPETKKRNFQAPSTLEPTFRRLTKRIFGVVGIISGQALRTRLGDREPRSLGPSGRFSR